jgi:hypothetical protein
VKAPSGRPDTGAIIRYCWEERWAEAVLAGASTSAAASSDALPAVPMARNFLKRLTPLLSGT